jgi:hypothetical protein
MQIGIYNVGVTNKTIAKNLFLSYSHTYNLFRTANQSRGVSVRAAVCDKSTREGEEEEHTA